MPYPNRFPHRLNVAAAALAVVACMLMGASKAQAANWLAPDTFTTSVQPSNPQAGLDAQGRLAAIWQESAAGPSCTVKGLDHAGGAFGSVQSLTNPAGAQFNCAPVLATDAAGDAVAVWVTDQNVFAATKTAGGAWSAAQTLDTVGTYSAPAVAINASGAATAVWVETNTGQFLRTARWSPGTTWTAPAATVDSNGSSTATFAPTAVAVDAAGNQRVLWSLSDAGNNTLRAASAGSGADLGSPVTVLGPTANGFDAIRVDPDGQGDFLALWRNTTTHDLSSALDSGSGFAAGLDTAQYSGAAQVSIDPPAVTFDSTGVATLVYSYSNDGTNYQILLRNRPHVATVNWTSEPAANTVDLQSTSVKSITRDAVTTVQGRLAIVYVDGGTVFEREGNSVSSLANPVTLGTGEEPVIAGSGAGYRAAMWGTSSPSVQVAVFDPVAPSNPVISGPTTGTAGQALSFSATAGDEWGPPTIAWDFGDGSAAAGNAANGATVAHTYSSPGTYTVSARADDRASNSSATQNQSVAVTSSGTSGTGATGGSGSTLPKPVFGVSANFEVVSGDVLVKVPGSSTFVPLGQQPGDAKQLPIGTIVDARKGRVKITVVDAKGNVFSGIFYAGEFILTQTVGPATTSRKKKPKSVKLPNAIATLVLYGGNFKTCPATPRGKRAALAKAKQVRQLWGEAKGAFRTKGRFASATVRGTTWNTSDRCDGTLVKVKSGAVVVRDLVKKRNVLVTQGHQYLARARRG